MVPERRTPAKRLVLACGNPARGDDGLGPAFIEALKSANITDLEARHDYQLRVEDALDIGDYQQVIFVDTDRHLQTAFSHHPLTLEQLPTSLDTHSTSPEALLQLARSLFGAQTPASILAIRGYEFEPFVEEISGQARENLQLALDYLLRELEQAV